MEKTDAGDPQVAHVTIFGREFALHSQESHDYTQKISVFVDRKMAEIADEKDKGDVTQVAIMAALDIADQLIKEKTKREADTQRVAAALRRLGQYLDGVDDGEESA